MQALQSEKLTKKFFMELPGGVYLMSNTGKDQYTPSWSEYVVPVSEREKQWKEIVQRGCNNRLCHVFKDEAQAKEWIKNSDSSPS